MSNGVLPGLGEGGTTLLASAERSRGVGLPFATLILSGVLSAAAFGIQMVQHSFEMRQANIENGFKFYFENRSQLKERTDADKEMSLLKLIGNAFPNVFCAVRQDTYERASSAETGVVQASAGPAPFGEADRKNIVSFLVAHDRPTSPQFPAGLIAVVEAAMFSRNGGGDPQPCDPLTNAPPATTLASGEPATGLPAPPAAAPAPSADQTAEEKKTETASRAQEVREGINQAAQGLFGHHIFRVYFHIGVQGTKHARPLDIADAFRDDLANQQFRVMQGVALVDTKILPDNPEVRYFGPEEKEAADKLAAYLTEKFKGESLVFTAKQIGDRFPAMNPDNIEVWLPDPGTAPKKRVSSKAAN
jgi:hypothetical protein